MTTYILDTDVLIDAKNRYYGFDFCPAFWEWLRVKNLHGIVESVFPVAQEIQNYAVEDELAQWATGIQTQNFFVEPNRDVYVAYERVTEWTMTTQHEEHTRQDFLNKADSWVIAHAIAHQGVVVTLEGERRRKSKIKIPVVCRALGINCMDTFEMLREAEVCFVNRKNTTSY